MEICGIEEILSVLITLITAKKMCGFIFSLGIKKVKDAKLRLPHTINPKVKML